ncbi:uncharacterized protein LOC132952138 [Metopolophium dirhodum]|uniref:uncharacterized protein LOC132952138 n=1 Tax=Metopolophium dirhodum TaxID=44670 RepID=UPI00298FFBE5|nr:uncharacterized protein LOC132952138 [Metopolophium dirhodum]
MTSKRSKQLLTLAKNFNDAKQQSTSTITKLTLRRNLMHSFNVALNSDINDQNNQHNDSNDNMEVENHTDVNEISCVNSKMNVQKWVNQCNFFDANEHKNNSVNMITLNGEDFEIIVQETPDYDNDVSVVLGTPEHVFEPDFAMNIESVENVESLGIIDNIENYVMGMLKMLVIAEKIKSAKREIPDFIDKTGKKKEIVGSNMLLIKKS